MACPHLGEHDRLEYGCEVVCSEPWGNGRRCRLHSPKKRRKSQKNNVDSHE